MLPPCVRALYAVGNAPTKSLTGVFNRWKEWMLQLIPGVKKSLCPGTPRYFLYSSAGLPTHRSPRRYLYRRR